MAWMDFPPPRTVALDEDYRGPRIVVDSTTIGFGVADCFPDIATKADVEAHFATHGTGEITEIKLMNGFGFIEYKDAMDARDVVPGLSSSIYTVR